MNTNWRELRESLANGNPFSTFSTFNHRGAGQEETQSVEENGVVKSAHSAKSPKTATNRGENPMANSVKSAESPGSDAEDSWEWILERAVILEFDGGMDREEANSKAFTTWYQRFVESE